MSWIEILSMLVEIPASVITILTAGMNYIKNKKDSKKTHQLACRHLMGLMTT